MQGQFGSEWTSAEPMSEINIVPLVDVLLVLLVLVRLVLRAAMVGGGVEICLERLLPHRSALILYRTEDARCTLEEFRAAAEVHCLRRRCRECRHEVYRGRGKNDSRRGLRSTALSAMV